MKGTESLTQTSTHTIVCDTRVPYTDSMKGSRFNGFPEVWRRWHCETDRTEHSSSLRTDNSGKFGTDRTNLRLWVRESRNRLPWNWQDSLKPQWASEPVTLKLIGQTSVSLGTAGYRRLWLEADRTNLSEPRREPVTLKLIGQTSTYHWYVLVSNGIASPGRSEPFRVNEFSFDDEAQTRTEYCLKVLFVASSRIEWCFQI